MDLTKEMKAGSCLAAVCPWNLFARFHVSALTNRVFPTFVEVIRVKVSGSCVLSMICKEVFLWSVIKVFSNERRGTIWRK